MPGTQYLLDFFWAINTSRGEGVSGPLPISNLELEAYLRLMDETLLPWEVTVIRAMDNAFLSTVREKEA